jgi:glutaredoxin-like protein NrdH
MIRVYSLPDCISCTLTLRAFERRGVEVEKIEMTPADVERFRAQGAMSAPIVDAGDLWWYGLRPDLIQEATNALKRKVGRPQGH